MTSKLLKASKIFFLIFFIGLMFQSSIAAEGIVNTQEKGEECFKQARMILEKMGIKLNRNILLKVRPKEEVQVHFISSGGRSIQVGGYYQPHSPETIWIVKGKPWNVTLGDMAHEFAHAWQSSNCPLQDRTLTEGFAMWCQYKALMSVGEIALANSYTQWKDPDYGGGLRLFLSIEKKDGVSAVLKYAKTAKKPPIDWKDSL